MGKYILFGLTIESNLDFEDQLPVSQYTTDILIQQTVIKELAREKTSVMRKGLNARILVATNYVILRWPGVVTFKIEAGSIIYFQSFCDDPETLKMFIVSEAIGIILFQRGLFLVHASAARIGEKAVIFMGESGAGKSTTMTAFAQNGHTVLSDDLVAIQLVDDKLYVLPAMPCYKVWQSSLDALEVDYRNFQPAFEGSNKYLICQDKRMFPFLPVELSQAFILSKERDNQEYALSPALSPIEFIKYFPLPTPLLNPLDLKRHFETSILIARNLPVTVLSLAKSFDLLKSFVSRFTG